MHTEAVLKNHIPLSAGPKEKLRKALVQFVSREKRRDILRFVTNLFMFPFSAIGSSVTHANPTIPLTKSLTHDHTMKVQVDSAESSFSLQAAPALPFLCPNPWAPWAG